MSFSVLLSVYYKENPAYLQASLDSIYAQTMPPGEVIMVEDGPLTPELNAVLDRFSKAHRNFKRISLPENRGLGRALNKGIQYCHNELIARMDTDDICFPERFEVQYKYMTNHPEIDICSSWIEEFETDIKDVKTVKTLPSDHDDIVRYMRKRNPMNHPAVMFRRKAVARSGGYKHFLLFEDWYLWIRMYNNGSRFANIPRPLLYFRSSPDMFKRRGGFKYAIDSARFQWQLHKMGLLGAPAAAYYALMRGFVYILPNPIRRFIYMTFLREKGTSHYR